MFVTYDTEMPPNRFHPWTVVAANPTDKYVDFKIHPDQIPLVLPDFVPWAHYPAIQRFYALLEWLNGHDSRFESNDCGLLNPRIDQTTPDFIRAGFLTEPLVIHGRLTILFRNLASNCSTETIQTVKRHIYDGLRTHVRNFPAYIKIGEHPHFFTEINKSGQAIALRFWAWGENEEVSMMRFSEAIDAVHECLKWISAGIEIEQ